MYPCDFHCHWAVQAEPGAWGLSQISEEGPVGTSVLSAWQPSRGSQSLCLLLVEGCLPVKREAHLLTLPGLGEC